MASYEIGESSSKKRRTDPDPLKDTSLQVHAVKGLQYDVFLSFRGSDFRQSFVACLYQRLVDAGILTFKDDEELPVGGEIGPELMRAIEQSKVSVPIFSKNYASSKWCLKEVTEIVKRMDERKHMIMPIFLDVTPNEVQHQTGSYEQPFSQHGERYGSETVQEWRDALQKIVKLKGLELEKVANGDHGELIKLVLARVLNSLKKGHVNVDEQILVGLDHKTEAVKRLLEVGGSGVKIVGIWGMGGIGKTTLAKVVYNQVLDQFESYCFLNDIRETKSTKGLPYLQSKLVSDILHERRIDFANTDEGIQQLKSRLGGKKAIILLDDVDHVDQLKGLAGSLAWFGPGSRIIITTRDKEVLDKFFDFLARVLDQFEVSNIYEVMPLSEDQGFELFCKHAFLKDSPTPDFIDLARNIVRATGMLPLTLEVIGSFLCTKSGRKEGDKLWQDTLEKLLRAKPEKAVQDKLEISYDGLSDTEKRIFLDIACIFIGMDSRTAIPMWYDCKWSPYVGIDVLISKSLIKITDENKFSMHDQIRDLGREIVERENYDHPGSRSRLWRPEEAIDVLNEKEGTAKVEAISLGDWDGSGFEGDHFRNLSKLRILQLGRATLGGKFKGLLAKLRWLSWQVWDSNATPMDLDLRNLISLDLSGSGVSEDWGGWRLMKVASKLKVLDLKGCWRLRKSPDLSSFPDLERLVLRGCRELFCIDPSIGQLIALVSLDLRDCVLLQALPNLEHLTKLEKLYLGCWDEDLLRYSGYKRTITKVPGLQGLISLETLKIGRSLITHLDGLEMLDQLRELEIRSTPIERLPNLSKLRRLAHITLAECEELRQVEGFEELESLEKLTILWCGEIEKLPDLSKLHRLKSLTVRRCENITEVRGLGGESLEEIEIRYCEALENLSSMSKLRSLRKFQIDNLSNHLREIVGLEGLDNLQTLAVRDCRGIEKLPDLSNLRGLKLLTIRNCRKITEVRGLGDLESLEEMDMYEVEALGGSVLDLSKLWRLKYLKVAGHTKPPEIVGLEGLDDLVLLEVSWFGKTQASLRTALGSRLDVSKLRRLYYLKIQGLGNLVEVVGLGDLKCLATLRVYNCCALEKLPDLAKLQSLELLHIDGCDNLTGIGPKELKCLESLTTINIRRCNRLTTVGFKDLKRIREDS